MFVEFRRIIRPEGRDINEKNIQTSWSKRRAPVVPILFSHASFRKKEDGHCVYASMQCGKNFWIFDFLFHFLSRASIFRKMPPSSMKKKKQTDEVRLTEEQLVEIDNRIDALLKTKMPISKVRPYILLLTLATFPQSYSLSKLYLHKEHKQC